MEYLKQNKSQIKGKVFFSSSKKKSEKNISLDEILKDCIILNERRILF